MKLIKKLKNKYDKAYKRLKKRIKYALWWNRKRIVLTSPLLTDETENANLALKGCPAFTFKDVLNNLLDEKNKKRKHKTQIIEKNKTISKLKTEKKNKNDEVKQQEQSFERLKQPPYHVNSVNTATNQSNTHQKEFIHIIPMIHILCHNTIGTAKGNHMKQGIAHSIRKTVKSTQIEM